MFTKANNQGSISTLTTTTESTQHFKKLWYCKDRALRNSKLKYYCAHTQ